MNVVCQLESFEFLDLMIEGLEDGSITTEEILFKLALYHGGVFIDDEAAVNSCMKILGASDGKES